MIYICIPAHNEDRTIGVLLWKVRQVLANFPRDYQILVADDASTDATAEVLGPYERVLPLVVFRNSERKGYATSLEMLLREAVRRSEYPKRDVVVTMQADFTEDPENIVAMLKRIEAGADVVTGERPSPEKTQPRGYRWGRRAASYLAGRRALPEGISDALTGLRTYRVLVVKKAIEARQGRRLMTWDGWAANAELLMQVQPHSRRTEALPIGFRPDRLQRATRFDFWGTLKQAWALARGRPGPLENVALPQPGQRETASPGHGRGRQGTRRLEAVSNGGGHAHGNGQRRRAPRDSQDSRRDAQDQRGREPRDGRSRRTRDPQESRAEGRRPEAQRFNGERPEAERSEAQRSETRQRRPRRDGQGMRPGQEPQGVQEGRSQERPRRERAQRARREQPAREANEVRREQTEPRPEQQPLEPQLLDATMQEAAASASADVAGEGAAAAPRKRRRRRRSSAARNKQSGVTQSEMFDSTPDEAEAGADDSDGPASEAGEPAAAELDSNGEPVKKRRRSRGRRGGRGRSRRSATGENASEQGDTHDEQVQSAGEAPPVGASDQ